MKTELFSLAFAVYLRNIYDNSCITDVNNCTQQMSSTGTGTVVEYHSLSLGSITYHFLVDCAHIYLSEPVFRLQIGGMTGCGQGYHERLVL